MQSAKNHVVLLAALLAAVTSVSGLAIVKPPKPDLVIQCPETIKDEFYGLEYRDVYIRDYMFRDLTSSERIQNPFLPDSVVMVDVECRGTLGLPDFPDTAKSVTSLIDLESRTISGPSRGRKDTAELWHVGAFFNETGKYCLKEFLGADDVYGQKFFYERIWNICPKIRSLSIFTRLESNEV